MALGRGLLAAGRTQIHVMPWTRQFGAAASKLKYRVRVCLEGIPSHAAQVETIAKLFPSSAFVEIIDTETPTEKEKACVCVWIWTVDPDGIAKEGVLRLEEPVEFTEEFHNDFYTRLGNMEIPEIRNKAAAMLHYKVLIHIDQASEQPASRLLQVEECGPGPLLSSGPAVEGTEGTEEHMQERE